MDRAGELEEAQRTSLHALDQAREADGRRQSLQAQYDSAVGPLQGVGRPAGVDQRAVRAVRQDRRDAVFCGSRRKAVYREVNRLTGGAARGATASRATVEAGGTHVLPKLGHVLDSVNPKTVVKGVRDNVKELRELGRTGTLDARAVRQGLERGVLGEGSDALTVLRKVDGSVKTAEYNALRTQGLRQLAITRTLTFGDVAKDRVLEANASTVDHLKERTTWEIR